MLEVRNLSVGILDDISFTLKDNVTTALIGKNGSGKTTLLRALSSYYPTYCGEVLFDGKEQRKLTSEEKKSMRFFLPQNLPIISLTVSELLSFSSKQESEESTRRIDTLSGGERSLVYIRMMESSVGSIKLLDEPYSALDTDNTKYLDRCLENKTALVSIHDINHALMIASDIMVLDKGKLVFHSSRDEFLSSSLIHDIFGLDKKILRDEEGKKHVILI